LRSFGLKRQTTKPNMQKRPFYPYISDRKQGQILNIELSSTSKLRVLSFVRDSISHKSKFLIVTPNPEIILEAQEDKKLAKILNSADLALPDGVGLVLSAKILGFPALNLIKGREMFLDLAKLANKKHWKIFLLGGRKDEAEAAAEILSRSLKGVKIAYSAGPELNQAGEPTTLKDRELEKDIVAQINNFAPQILFIGFGAPKQEKWTAKWYRKLNVGGAMVVGGTFNYISGRASLPPKWMENYGLEWLWRLITQPWRIVRIFKATVVFPIKVFLYKLKQ